jgi:Tetratricopeptide repeat
MFAKHASLASGATLVVGTIVALLLAWWVLVAGFRALHGADETNDAAFTQIVQGGAPPPPDATWREQIARNPTDARPYRKLARVLEKEGKVEEARAGFEQALRLDPTHPQVLQDAAGFYLRAGDATRALPLLARAVELYPSRGTDVWPVFAGELESGRGAEFLLRAARENPPWWSRFFREVCAEAENEALLTQVFTVRADAGALTNAERTCLIGRMQRAGRWREAYEIWRASLPREQRGPAAPVFNGGFEWPLSNLGFDWIVPRQDTASVDAEPIDGAQGKRALRVTFVNKLYTATPIYQYLMLRAGRYQLEGLRRADGLESWLGLQWGLYCYADGDADLRQLARTEPFAGSGGWGEFRRDFAVPAGCPVQILRLELANPRRDANSPGAVPARLRGTLWFDDLEITPLG